MVDHLKKVPGALLVLEVPLALLVPPVPPDR